MTLDRDGVGGPFTLECDIRDCHEILETDCFNFGGAREKWRSRGWMAHFVEGEWVHLCPEHEEEYKAGKLEL